MVKRVTDPSCCCALRLRLFYFYCLVVDSNPEPEDGLEDFVEMEGATDAGRLRAAPPLSDDEPHRGQPPRLAHMTHHHADYRSSISPDALFFCQR